jgi:hypothetical protein
MALPDLVLEWEYDVASVSERGFKWNCPTLGDLDGDGTLEIVAASEKGGRLVAVRHPGQLMWVFPPLDEDPGGRMNKLQSIYDIDSDGGNEVIFTSGDPPRGSLYILNGDGTLQYNWTNPEANFKYGGTVIRDVDLDGVMDIVCSGADSKIYVFNAAGELQWEKFLPPGRSIDSFPNAFDIDRDGEVEIIAFAREGRAEGENGRVYCLSPTGQEKWSWSSTKVDQLHNMPVVADINNDGEYEVIVGIWDFDQDGEGGIVILNFFGLETHRKHMPHRVGYTAMVADLEGDGQLEIVTGGRDLPGIIYCLNPDLSEKWIYNFTELHNASNTLNMGGALGDITGDGIVDVVFQTRQNSTVYVLDNTGMPAANPYNIGEESTNAIVIGDIDNDGKSEIVACAGTKMVCLTMDGTYHPETFMWTQAGKDSMGTAAVPIPEIFTGAIALLALLLIRKR